ncbi:hypothetical protein [Pseudomonas gingeri]|uniref:hypothetical protein n=1 Tax=Pseudomonas gingeri TaxID=117681 RepID=UPI0015A2543D|nr:hypothetical protein [Pseudomonas gingeri]NWD04070.1 hypothetical protein [Pseudomonas gingeri]NWE33868.1 hypothetical protein [Pseudomonas gingeri]NWE58046.1 hypothetical protein [Pseudomonas gingeri]NWF04405.1 hypothetical protein [Pseudomonas gingeri]
MTHAQDTIRAQAALLRINSRIATPVTNSCCEAASIIAPLSATTEGLVPHEKLREAATPKASLIALDRPPAQPAKGYKHPTSTAGSRVGGPRYWPADLTDVRPDEWAQMSPRHVAEFAGTTEVWLLLEAAQQRIAELEERYANALVSGTDHETPAELLACNHGDDDVACMDCLRKWGQWPFHKKQDVPAPSNCLQVSSLREAMENTAASGKRCTLTIGNTRLQVSYHGIKWYHDLITPGRSSLPLTSEEFDQAMTRALGIEATQRATQIKAVTP